ncbi:ABC transporter permease [Pseudomonas sp. MOB-449]|nr:ABC transporter permease [Pseudomonas sp. MOB-449]
MMAVSAFLADRQQRLGGLLALPTIGYLLIFFVVPTLILFVYSFWSSRAFMLIPDASIKNYLGVFTSQAFYMALWTGAKVGFWTALFSVILSFPVAHYIAFNTKSNIILYLVLISWFSSYLVKIYAWKTILGTNGLINTSLMDFGVIDAPLEFFIFSPLAVIITLTHIFLPFTLLLLLSALKNIKTDYIEAARDLGASRAKTFMSVVMPMAYKGVVGSFMFTFILAAGDFITPQLLGGKQGVTAGLVIANQFRVTGNWPYGAAMAFILLGFFMIVYYALIKTLYVLKLSPGRRYHD